MPSSILLKILRTELWQVSVRSENMVERQDTAKMTTMNNDNDLQVF